MLDKDLDEENIIKKYEEIIKELCEKMQKEMV